MDSKASDEPTNPEATARLPADFWVLSQHILRFAGRARTTVRFLRFVCKSLADFTGCDSIEIRLSQGDRCTRHEVTVRPDESVAYEVVECPSPDREAEPDESDPVACLGSLRRDVVLRLFDPAEPFFTANGTFWTPDTARALVFTPRYGGRERRYDLRGADGYRSIAMIPLSPGSDNVGLLTCKSHRSHHFTASEIELYELVGQSLSVALAHHETQSELRERVNELTCLFGITRLSTRQDLSLQETLRQIVELVRQSLLHSDVAHARLTLDGVEYETPGFVTGEQRLSAPLVISGAERGDLEVVYSEDRPELDEGPFLREERGIVDTAAREASLIVERKAAEEESARLQLQLRHADRLATIGQLAAGIAHELNEPLGSILGFAQLAVKSAELPEQSAADVQKIVDAAIHAREVIRKLMLFARQHPTRRMEIDLSAAVRDGLYLLEARCSKMGIELKRELAVALPTVSGDPAQLRQVLVNLVVNAIQAMPDGGLLIVRTAVDAEDVVLTVEDTGVGMSEDVLDKIFLPFFTTKDVGEGTGLGLAMVHGIITAHGGTIDVRSRLGRGTGFDVRLPIRSQGDKERD